MNKLNRHFAAVLVVLLVAMLFGCAPSSKEPKESDSTQNDSSSSTDASQGNEQVELILSTIPGPVAERLVNDVEAFMKENPNIKIKINEFPEAKYMDQGPRLFSSSEKPDLAWFWADADYKKIADAGVLEPLDDMYQSEGWDHVLPQSTIDRVRAKDGKVYAVNTEIVWGPVVYYNKAAFEKAGVDVPKTMDEWYQIGPKLKEVGYIPLVSGNADVGVLILSGLLANSFKPDDYVKLTNSEIKDPVNNYNHEHVVNAFDHVKKMGDELMQKGAAGVNDTDARALFTQGKAAMYSNGSWAASDALLGKELPKDFQLGYFYYPQIYNDIPPKVAVYAGNSLLVMKGTGKEQYAKKFLTFVMSKERQKVLAQNKQLFPSRIDLSQQDIEPMGPLYVDMYQKMNELGVMNFWHTEVNSELSTAARALVPAVMSGQKTPQQAAQELQSILEKSK